VYKRQAAEYVRNTALMTPSKSEKTK
jgi:hypothetical protein